MWSIFDLSSFLFLLAAGVAAFLVGTILGAVRREGKKSFFRGLQAALLAFLGGLLARGFIGLILTVAGDSPGTTLAVGWLFFLWPGVVDTIPYLLGAQLLTSPVSLLWFAAVVGSFTGMMDGIWRIHKWKGPGVLSFLLDVTWGLSGSINGALVHLVNFAWADHADEPARGAHRYKKGFRFKGGFAVTLGAVMSNMGSHGPTTPLFAHENTHVWQNRIFGPLFTLTYLGWMVVMFVPGIIAGAVSKVGAAKGIEQWCYFNNPWEAWAYRVGAGPRSRFGSLIWSDVAVLIASIPFFASALGGFALGVAL